MSFHVQLVISTRKEALWGLQGSRRRASRGTGSFPPGPCNPRPCPVLCGMGHSPCGSPPVPTGFRDPVNGRLFQVHSCSSAAVCGWSCLVSAASHEEGPGTLHLADTEVTGLCAAWCAPTAGRPFPLCWCLPGPGAPGDHSLVRGFHRVACVGGGTVLTLICFSATVGLLTDSR